MSHAGRWVAFVKLAHASPREMFARARRATATSWLRHRFRRAVPLTAERVWVRRLFGIHVSSIGQQEAATRWCAAMRRCTASTGLPSPAELDDIAGRYAVAFPARIEDVCARAQRVSRREFAFLGISFQTPAAIPWQCDPRTGRKWPRAFFADITLDPAVSGADVRLTWELNRQQFLLDSAAAYVLTRAQHYAADAAAIIQSWITDNPYLEGVNWISPLEAAIRMLTWLWTYQLCRESAAWSPEGQYALAKALYQHGEYIERYLSSYTSPNNHLVGEATALFALGTALPQLDRAAHWRQRGFSILCAQVTRQFHADGGSVEQSMVYHHFTLGCYLLLLALCRRARAPVPAELHVRIERALEWSMWMTRPDGLTPAIGDADDSRVPLLTSDTPLDFRSHLAIGAALYRRADMKWVAGDCGEAVLWLLGPQPFEAYRALQPRPPEAAVRTFPDSGYAVLRTGWEAEASVLYFDAGPIAAGLERAAVPSAAHGHADLLSFEACALGVPAIVDPGCYTYRGDPAWHRYFRETHAHNTARVDGRSQARFRGPWTWSHAARPAPLRVSDVDAFTLVESGHSGFDGLEGAVRHRRAILWRGRRWYVFDYFDGSGAHGVEVFFHLAPCRISTKGAGGVLASFAHDVHLMLQMAGGLLQLQVVDHGEGPAGGWLAPSYGVRQRAPVLRFYGDVRLPLCVTFAAVASRPRPPGVRLTALQPAHEPAGGPSATAGCRLWGDGIDEDVEVCWSAAHAARVSLRQRVDRGE